MDAESGRRIDDVEYYQKLLFNTLFREEELSKYIFIDGLNRIDCRKYLDDHIDFVSLLLLHRMEEGYFLRSTALKLHYVLEGYLFALSNGFIDILSFYRKVNEEIVERWLFPATEEWNKIAVYRS